MPAKVFNILEVDINNYPKNWTGSNGMGARAKIDQLLRNLKKGQEVKIVIKRVK